MTALRILNVVLWIAVMVYMASGAWTAAKGRGVRRGDPMRLACFFTGFIFSCGYLRLLLAPDNELAWAAVHVMSAIDAVYIIALGRAYGRGPHVG